MATIDELAASFQPAPDAPGCDTCGGRLTVTKSSNPMGEAADPAEVLLIDCIHSEASCPTLRKRRGTIPMSPDMPWLWVRHRGDGTATGEALADRLRQIGFELWAALVHEKAVQAATRLGVTVAEARGRWAAARAGVADRDPIAEEVLTGDEHLADDHPVPVKKSDLVRLCDELDTLAGLIDP